MQHSRLSSFGSGQLQIQGGTIGIAMLLRAIIQPALSDGPKNPNLGEKCGQVVSVRIENAGSFSDLVPTTEFSDKIPNFQSKQSRARAQWP